HVVPPDLPSFPTRRSSDLFAGFTFYRGGSIVPVLGIAVDPTNQFSMEPFWTVDYFLRDDLVLNFAQRYFVAPRGHHTPIFETWGDRKSTRLNSSHVKISYA